MSFSWDVKTELMGGKGLLDEQRPFLLALAYGISCFAKYFDEKGIVLHSDQVLFVRYAQLKLRALGIEGKAYKRPKGGYEFSVKDSKQVDAALALFHRLPALPFRLCRENIENDQCFPYFLTGAFLAGGLVTDPQKEYLLEFSTPNEIFAADFVALLTEQGFQPKSTLRKGQQIIYFRASEQIEDLLTTMGAINAAFEVMNSKILKDIRNRANRVTNCETANIDKTVLASEKHLRYISMLEAAGGLSALPEDLRQVAVLRMDNPEMSLAELGTMCVPKLTKSGVSHRLKKIENTALAWEERRKNGN